MLTPQEVSSHTFTKAVMGGYNMAMVDEFLDELTDDYSSLYKENATLKAKLKVLVEKVEDYRTTEDSMRATLLTAQKMADNIVHEAEAKRDAMISAAELESKEKLEAMQRELDQGNMRLRKGQEDLARFINACRSVCQQELQLLEQLPEVKLDIPEPAATETPMADAIEERIFASFAESENLAPESSAVVESEPEEVAEAVEAEAVETAGTEEVGEAPEETAEDEQDMFAQTRRIDLQDLKFGRNYENGD